MGLTRSSSLFLALVSVCWMLVAVQGACKFPEQWTGLWFQSGEQKIQITPESISLKGRCLQVDGDKFLTESRESHERCYRCVVILQKHINVLQYKETDCDSFDKPTLETLCGKINGDAPLFSMFRVHAEPEGCPFHGTFTFSYSRGLTECRNPISSVDSCTEDSRLLFRYQACPDVTGSESTVEMLICLATWKEGSTRFLVGQLEHSLAISPEDTFRCFVYDELEDDSGYQVAQSGDATCIGLFLSTEGFRTMRLSRVSSAPTLCEFPKWLTVASTWLSLDSKIAYIFDLTTNATMNATDMRRSRQITTLHAVCTERVHNAEKTATIVVHATIGCRNGYMCLKFYGRRNNIIELQKGTLAVNPEDACLHAHFNASSAEFITLLTSNFEPNRCPYLGKYDVVGLQKPSRKDMKTRDSCKDFTSVDAGCVKHDEIEFLSSCPNTQKTHKYQCHANWEEDGINYLITTQRGSKVKFCFMYVEMENGLKFSSSRETCSRKIQPGINGYMAFNITDKSDCISHLTVESIATTTTRTTTSFVIPFLGLYHFITLLLVFQVR